jgi:hypothetical protein
MRKARAGGLREGLRESGMAHYGGALAASHAAMLSKDVFKTDDKRFIQR